MPGDPSPDPEELLTQALLTGTLGDFRLLRQVGRGGMGVVYEAEQISLGRRVALKVLPFAATMDPRQLQRFHNEARAAAGLHHTNIVPVYAVGCERGVHYYAMQFIEGRTLAELIAQQRGGPPSVVLTVAAAEAAPACATTVPPAAQATSAAPREAASFRRVAEWGIQAAEALDCAHALGVVHRDVKPANLMVDAGGRLWVTDFGLAQVQSDARLTMTGDLVGTLRYMSPEQALAKRVVIDHRTDVYSLGATLYELLTLRPAYTGNDRQELLRQIAFEEPPGLRRLCKAVPAELETIVLKAMEKNPQDRYATAQELAEDLERYLRDEPIRARRPSLAQGARKWARRHRALVRAATALVLALVLLGGAALWREQRQRAAVARAVEGGLARAELLQQQEQWEEAGVVLAVAEGELEGRGLGALRERVRRWKRDVDFLTRLEEARLQLAAGGKETGFDYAGADRLYAGAFAGYGLDVTTLGSQEVAEQVRASAICTRLIVGLDDWASVRDQLIPGSGAPLRAVAEQADDDPWRRRLRGAARGGDRAALEGLAEEEGAGRQPTANLVLLARALESADSGAKAERLLRPAQAGHPEDFWINFELANSLIDKKAPDAADAVRFYQAALALRPQSYPVYINLGAALVQQGKQVEAVAAFHKAIALKPDDALAHSNLGSALAELGKQAEAVTAYQKAIALKPDLANAHNNLGAALKEQGKLAEAVAAYRKAIELKPDDAVAYNNLGAALAEQGKQAEAVAAYQKAIALKSDYVEAHCNLGTALQKQGHFADALAAIKRGHELGSRQPNWRYPSAQWVREAERLVELDAKLPKVLKGETQPTDAAERIILAQLCHLKKRYVAAARFYADAFVAQPTLADDPNTPPRYDAACAAALAGCGQGEDTAQLDNQERSRLRRQALDWLRADLEAWRRRLEKEPDKARPVIVQQMQHWLEDTDFAGVRGPEAIAKLPEAERRDWQQLWADVADTLARAQKQPVPEKKSGTK